MVFATQRCYEALSGLCPAILSPSGLLQAPSPLPPWIRSRYREVDPSVSPAAPAVRTSVTSDNCLLGRLEDQGTPRETALKPQLRLFQEGNKLKGGSNSMF